MSNVNKNNFFISTHFFYCFKFVAEILLLALPDSWTNTRDIFPQNFSSWKINKNSCASETLFFQ